MQEIMKLLDRLVMDESEKHRVALLEHDGDEEAHKAQLKAITQPDD